MPTLRSKNINLIFTIHKNLLIWVFNQEDREGLMKVYSKKKSPVHSCSPTLLGCFVDFDFGDYYSYRYGYVSITEESPKGECHCSCPFMEVSTWGPALFYHWWSIILAETQLPHEIFTWNVQSALTFPIKTLVTIPEGRCFSDLLPHYFLTRICENSGNFCHSKSAYQKTKKFIASPTQWDA